MKNVLNIHMMILDLKLLVIDKNKLFMFCFYDTFGIQYMHAFEFELR